MKNAKTDSCEQEFTVLFERHLETETALVSVLEKLNDQMANTLDQAGIYGPKPADLERLSPIVETLQQRSQSSQQSRRELYSRCSDGQIPIAEDQSVPLKSMLSALPDSAHRAMDRKRVGLAKRLLAAQQRLAANQAALFYSMDFHRRYLMGVLGSEDEEGSYQASGQSNKLSPEKIIGRNC